MTQKRFAAVYVSRHIDGEFSFPPDVRPVLASSAQEAHDIADDLDQNADRDYAWILSATEVRDLMSQLRACVAGPRRKGRGR